TNPRRWFRWGGAEGRAAWERRRRPRVRPRSGPSKPASPIRRTRRGRTGVRGISSWASRRTSRGARAQPRPRCHLAYQVDQIASRLRELLCDVGDRAGLVLAEPLAKRVRRELTAHALAHRSAVRELLGELDRVVHLALDVVDVEVPRRVD